MEAIKIYLDSVFAAAPNTEEIRRLKEELLANMEEKYTELKADGVSENEAIGSVISDFGNVDELFAEMVIVTVQNNVNKEDNYPLLTAEKVDAFLTACKKAARGISLAILLILIGVVQMLALTSVFSGSLFARTEIVYTPTEQLQALGVPFDEAFAPFETLVANPNLPTFALALMILFIIPAVALIIRHSFNLANFKDIDRGHFRLDSVQQARLKVEADRQRAGLGNKITIGISMIFLAIAMIVLSVWVEHIFDYAIAYAIMFFLLAVGVAARIFIIVGIDNTAYDKLLQRNEYSPESRKSSQLLEAISSVYWPLVVFAYLGWSFVTGNWHITWVIWPVAGIIYGGIAAFLPGLVKNEG